MAPTIRDVALLADVHPSTVSRVFTGHGKISTATRERVLDAANQLGFHPNGLARSLSRNLAHTLGIVIPHVQDEFFVDPFFPQVLKGVMAAAFPRHFRLIVSGSSSPEEEIGQSFDMLRSRVADGIIVLTTRLDGAAIDELRCELNPFVILGRPPHPYADLSWVDTDNVNATAEATEHLVRLGHRVIAFIGGHADAIVTIDRLKGYRMVLERYGVGYDESLVACGHFHQAGGAVAMERLLACHPTLTGVVVASDLMAVGALETLQRLGYRVPADVSLVGTNDSVLVSLTDPALTSIHVPHAEMGRLAAQALIEMILGEWDHPFRKLLPCTLVVRRSTGPAPDR